jgi:hypothetical protein
MKNIYPDLLAWEFELDEVSVNVYEVVEHDKPAPTKSFSGKPIF